MNSKSVESYLPLTTSTYYILLTLVNPLHGYGIAKFVDKISNGKIKLSAGTLYGALNRLERDGIIRQISLNKDIGKKLYQLTDTGRRLLDLEFNRLSDIVSSSRPFIQDMIRDYEAISG